MGTIFNGQLELPEEWNPIHETADADFATKSGSVLYIQMANHSQIYVSGYVAWRTPVDKKSYSAIPKEGMWKLVSVTDEFGEMEGLIFIHEAHLDKVNVEIPATWEVAPAIGVIGGHITFESYFETISRHWYISNYELETWVLWDETGEQLIGIAAATSDWKEQVTLDPDEFEASWREAHAEELEDDDDTDPVE